MIGGDLKVEKYRYRARPQRFDFVLFPHEQSSKQITMFTVIMVFCRFTMNTGPFLAYQNFFKCGIIEILLIYIASLILVQISNHVYTRCWFYGTAYDYKSIWMCVFGTKKFDFIPTVLNILVYLTYVCEFCLEIHKNGADLLTAIWPNCPSVIKSKWFLLYVINVITTVPCLCVKRFISLGWVSYLGNIAKVVAIICLILILCQSIHTMKFNVAVEKVGKIDNSFPYSPYITLFSSDPSVLFKCFSSCMFAFFVNPVMNLIFSEMKNPTVFRCFSTTWIGNFISLIAYYGIGLIVYFIFQTHLQYAINQDNNQKKNNTSFNLFESFHGKVYANIKNLNLFYNYERNLIEAVIGQFACYIATITSNIIYVNFIATQVASLVIDRKEDDIQPVFISGVVVILFAIGIQSMENNVIIILDVISTCSIIILLFLLPSFFYLKLYKFAKPFWSIMSILLLIIGIPIGVVCLYYKCLDVKLIFG